MNKKQKLLLVCVIVLTMGLLVSGCGGSGSSGGEEEADVFKVGVLTSLSGAEVYGGNLTRRGYDLWAETVNEAGGIDIGGTKYKVEMYYADDQSDPASGADAAERMITKDKVDFILGPYTSGVTLASAPICEKYKIPMVTGSAESPLIWVEGFKYTFGTIPAVNLTASYAVNTLAEEVQDGAKSIAIIGVNDAFSKATAESFKAAAEDLGVQVVKFDIVPAGTDFTPLLSAIKSLNPDVLAVGGHEKEHMEIIKASKSLNFMPKAFLMHYGVTNPDFVNNLGKDAEGVYGASVWTADIDRPNALFGSVKEYNEAFKNRWGDYPDYTATGCVVAGEVFEAALKQAQLTPPLSEEERDKLVATLEEIQADTLYGTVDFATEGDWYHNNVGLKALTIQIQDGVVKVVGPQSGKLAEPIYPIPAWGER